MSKFCQRCRQSNPSEALFCLNCASPLQPGSAFSGGQPAHQQWNQPKFVNNPGSNGSEASSRAKLSLGLSLAGLLCLGPLASIPAIILGGMEISAINQGQAAAAGKSMSTFGVIIGIGAILLQLGVCILWMLLAVAASSDTYNY